MQFSRRSLLAAIAMASCLIAFHSSRAQGYPVQPVRILVPYVPGGLPDTVARIVAQKLTESLGQSFVVDNKPGAGGAVAALTLAHAPADGYTLMVTDGSMLAIQKFVNAKPVFDAERDFAPVSLIGIAPLYLAVNANLKVNNLDDLVALARAKPGMLSYGSSGIGSVHHLTAEAMNAALGVNIRHIPYRGSGQSVPAMIGGQVDMIFASPPALMGFVSNGRAKLMAINAARRSPQTPTIPALAEKIPGFDFAFNVVMLARPGIPASVAAKINAEIAKIVKMPEVIEQLQKAGVDPVGASVQQTGAALHLESNRIGDAARLANLKPE
jgi:tripartite-type tricarboxylate transporter receptor subunit TctC